MKPQKMLTTYQLVRDLAACPSRKLQLNVETSRHKPLALATQRSKGKPDLPQGPSACRIDLSPQVHPHEKLLGWLRQSLGQTCLNTCCSKHIRLATWSPLKGGCNRACLDPTLLSKPTRIRAKSQPKPAALRSLCTVLHEGIVEEVPVEADLRR